jgi:metal-sulfur cluster biosynthetic enzyme
VALPTKEQVIDTLRPIQDPEIQIGLVDLGLIYDVDISNKGAVTVKMTLTTPACPYGEILLTNAHTAVQRLEGVTGVEILLVWDPLWDPKTMCSDEAKDRLGIW